MKTFTLPVLVTNVGERLFRSTEYLETMLGKNQRLARQLFTYRNIENSLFGLAYLVLLFWTGPSMSFDSRSWKSLERLSRLADQIVENSTDAVATEYPESG